MVCISNKEITRELHVKLEWPCGRDHYKGVGVRVRQTYKLFPSNLLGEKLHTEKHKHQQNEKLLQLTTSPSSHNLFTSASPRHLK